MSQAFAATQVIDRPVDHVWQVLTDWDRAHEWMSGVDSSRAAGTTLHFRARGRERTSEITDLRPGESVTLTSVQGGVRADYTYTVANAGNSTDGTQATLVASVVTSGAWRLVAPALRAVIRRTDGGQLDALKRLVEG